MWKVDRHLVDGNAEDQLNKSRVAVRVWIALISVHPVSVVTRYVGRGVKTSNSDAIAADSPATLMPDQGHWSACDSSGR